MTYRLFVCLCISFVFTGGVFGQINSTNENDKYYSFENGQSIERVGPRPKNTVVAAGNTNPVTLPNDFFGQYFIDTKELLLYWNTEFIIDHVEFTSRTIALKVYNMPILTSGKNTTRVILELDTEVQIPDDDYDIRLITEDGTAFGFTLGFNKDTLE
jgi:hypothetical protein